MSRAVIVLHVDDADLSDIEIHEAVITALDLAGFRSWTSYVARPDEPLPPAPIPPELQ